MQQSGQQTSFPNQFNELKESPEFKAINIPNHGILLLRRKELGEGGCGKVFEGRRYTLKNGTYQIEQRAYAVKEINSQRDQCEFKLMQLAYGEDKCFQATHAGREYLGMPLFGDDLFKWRQKNPAVNERYKILSFFFTELARLHEMGIIHGDLKLENIVFKDQKQGDQKQEAKVAIIDFGFSHKLNGKQTEVKEGGYTPGHMPPEFFNQKISKASDIFTSALVVIQLLGLGATPHKRILATDSKFHSQAFTKNHDKYLSLLPFSWNEQKTQIDEFLQSMQSQDPTKRPSARACADFFNSLTSTTQDSNNQEHKHQQPTPLPAWRPVRHELWERLAKETQTRCNQIIKKIKGMDKILQLHFMEYYIKHIKEASNAPQNVPGPIDISDNDFREGQIAKKTYFNRQKSQFTAAVQNPTNLENRAFLYACENMPKMTQRSDEDHDQNHLHLEVATRTLVSLSAISLSTYLVYPAIIALMVANPIGAMVIGMTVLCTSIYLSGKACQEMEFPTNTERVLVKRRTELEARANRMHMNAAT